MSRSSVYRIGVIHREISMGAFPNAEDLGDVLEVSYKTILRDIRMMREQFDFPIEYDYFKKGFFYNITQEQSLDIMYWQSIFSRMISGISFKDFEIPEPRQYQLAHLLHEIDKNTRGLLENIFNIIQLGGCIYVKKGASKYSATPLYIFKRSEKWYLVFSLEFDGSRMSLEISRCTSDGKSHISVNMNDCEHVLNVAMHFNGNCTFPKGANICCCAKDGIIHTCSSVKASKLFVVEGE